MLFVGMISWGGIYFLLFVGKRYNALAFYHFFMELQKRLQVLKVKLDELIDKDVDFKVFGAGDDVYHGVAGHHYLMNPPLSENLVQSMEKIVNVRFPEEYREFLKVICNGETGPYWGLYPLQLAVPAPGAMDQDPEFCSTSFPYSDADVQRIVKVRMHENPEYFEPVQQTLKGQIILSLYGHTNYYILPVSGEQAGKVWIWDTEGTVLPLYRVENGKPVLIDGKPVQLGFLDWYEGWLDDSLALLAG